MKTVTSLHRLKYKEKGSFQLLVNYEGSEEFSAQKYNTSSKRDEVFENTTQDLNLIPLLPHLSLNKNNVLSSELVELEVLYVRIEFKDRTSNFLIPCDTKEEAQNILEKLKG